MKPIFVGIKNSGTGYHVYPDEGSLVTESPSIDRVIKVVQDGKNWDGSANWREVERAALPDDAMPLVSQRLAAAQSEALSLGKRIVRTNSSYSAAYSRGSVATIFTRRGRYAVVVREWSKWEGEGETNYTAGVYDTLEDARDAAEKECDTRPSFGNVEYC